MRLMKIALIVLLVVPAWCLAQADAPRRPGDPPREPSRDPRDFGPGRFGGFWRRPPTQEEWDAAIEFMKQNSPRRWEAMQKLSKERQEPLKDAIFRRYRLLEMLRMNDSEVYDLHLKRVALEDEIFGLTRDLRNATTEESKVRDKLKDKIASLVDLGMDERKLRIARWQRQLASEQEQLSREQSARNDTIRKRLRAAEREDGTLGSDSPEEASSQSTTVPATRASSADQ